MTTEHLMKVPTIESGNLAYQPGHPIQSRLNHQDIQGQIEESGPGSFQRLNIPLPSVPHHVPQNKGFMDFTNLEAAQRCVQIIIKSGLAPDIYRDKPERALMAIQMGLELGFKPIQALQSIDVIQGRPSIRAVAQLALCKTAPDFEYCVEGFDGEDIAWCKVKRRNQPEVVRRFSMADAATAGLSNKAGGWKTYPKRMLQNRARSWALTDCYADKLHGLSTIEEMEEAVPFQQQTYEAAPVYEHIGDKIKAELRLKEEKVSNETINVETGEIVAKPTSNEHHDIYQELTDLIMFLQVPQETINKWLNKASVGVLDDLSIEQMQKIIVKLEKDVEKVK
ncbi:MAG: hypothetical protein ACHP9Y_01285 [Gammaproteobacteria bacterium]